MVVRVHVSADLLRQKDAVTWDVEAHTIAECLAAIEARAPGARRRLIDDHGRLRPLIRFYVNGAETVSLTAPLAGDEEVVFESADIAARTRVHALARFRRRAHLDDEYERLYGPLTAEGGCSGEVGEGIALALIGGALFAWGVGSIVGLTFLPLSGEGSTISIPTVLATVLGGILLAWGLRNIFIDLFE